MKIKLTFLLCSFWCSAVWGQDTIPDPHLNKVIPDKVFEIGLPLLLIFFLVQTLVTILKNRGETRLKEKAIDKGISEATLIQLFGEDKNLKTLFYFKWFLMLAALGLAFLTIHALGSKATVQSPYIVFAIITLAISIAFFIYWLIIQKK